MTVWKGYSGKILTIDLTNKKNITTELNSRIVKDYVGALGINCKLGLELIHSKNSSFSPETPIIIGAGPLIGTLTPGASRIVALTKFPATGAIANSCGGMSFGFYMKQAGYDHIIIKGKAQTPVYLEIFNDNITIIDAEDLWGKDIIETTDILWRKVNPCGIIAIGQAGENLVKSALTLIDKTSTFGRGGLGAVMGSKNLKAIMVYGSKGIPIADFKFFNKVYTKLFERIKNYSQRESWHELGMLRNLPIGMLLMAKGEKKKVRQSSDRIYLKKLKKRRIACPSCPMGDKDILKIKEGNYQGLINYNSSVINPFLMLLHDNIKTYQEAVKLFDLINRYGLDSLSITALFEFLERMFEEDVLNEENTGFKWNSDLESLLKLIHMTANREGFGDILAGGWKKLANTYNLGDKMLTVKGLDVVFEPRVMRLGTMEFEQIVNPKGAHVASGGSPTYVSSGGSEERFKSHFQRMGIPEDAINRIFSPLIAPMRINIARLTRYSEDWYTILTNLGICARAQMNRFYNFDLILDLYNSVTGFNSTKEEMRIAAERSWNLLKILNIREGFSRKDDQFPKEWFKPLKYGSNELKLKDFFGEINLTPEIAECMIDDYYSERGWNKKNGYPSDEKLKELGLESLI
ncbi:MAG: aldehyde ferredoxin oxidoreductase N-terminal domain-containing protein [Promethearchaeota archaeon]